MGFLDVLTIVFIILKLINAITWSWWLVLLPGIIEIAIIIFVAWAPFQRIDEEHKEKTAEQMFNDLGYEKRVFDDFIMYEKGDYTRLKIIEFHLRTEIVHSYIEYAVGNAIKNLDVDELKAINKQCEELNWL
jgi:hypothetical protein